MPSLKLKENIVPQVHKTYLEDCDSDNDPLSHEDFLHLFGLRKICLSSAWKWMNHMGFSYDERQKSYFSDCHENNSNEDYWKQILKKYYDIEKRTYRRIQTSKELAKNWRRWRWAVDEKLHIFSTK